LFVVGLFVAILYDSLTRKRWSQGFWIAVPVIAALTWQRIPAWKSSQTLAEATIKSNPRSFLAHNNLGMYWADRDQHQKAFTAFQTATQANPKYQIAHNNLGAVLVKLGDIDAAIDHFETA